jgi:aspartate racemase
MTLLAAFKTWLFGLTGAADISIGTPVNGRTWVETEALIGFFINTLVLRTSLTGDPTFRELLGRVREVTLGAYAHQDLPFEKLVEVLRPPRDLGQNPLFQVNFRVAGAPPAPLALPGLVITPLELIDNATSKFDLALELAVHEGASSYFEYSTDLFEPDTIVAMSESFQTLLASVLENPDARLKSLKIVAELASARTKQPIPRAALPKVKPPREIKRRNTETAPDGPDSRVEVLGPPGAPESPKDLREAGFLDVV